MRKRLFDLASKSGMWKPALQIYDSLGGSLISFDPEISDELKNGWDVDVSGKVLLPITESYMGVGTTLYCSLAHLFFARGVEPILTVCECDLPACIRMDGSTSKVSQATCDMCTYTGFKGIDKFGLSDQIEKFNVSSLPSVETEQATYKGINISRPALSSSRKILKKYSIDLTNSFDRQVYDNLLQTCAILVDEYNRIINENDIRAIVSKGPLYYNGAIPLAVGRSHNIPIYTWSVGITNQSAVFTKLKSDIQLMYNSQEEIVESRLSQPLSTTQTNQIQKYMQNRKQGENLRSFHGQSRQGTLEANTSTIGVFTNLLWDATPRGYNGTFDDAFEWIHKTIEILSNVDADIIVKTHPAESLRETNESVYEAITKKLEPLPSNICVLPPDTDVNTYKLFEELDVGVVWTSTVGLEMAYEGIPVVVGGDPHYRDLNITFDPDTKGMYKKTLQNILSLKMDERRKLRAQRYAYHIFIEKHIDFPFYDTDKTGSWKTVPITKDMFAPGNETFDTLVNNIMNNKYVSNLSTSQGVQY